MKKKLLLCCTILFLCAGRLVAQNDEKVWHMITDTRLYIPMEQVEYLLFADESLLFSVVKTNNEIISDVASVSFAEVPLAVEDAHNDRFDISIFPNPVASYLHLQGISQAATAQVLSLDGAVIIETALQPGKADINLSALTPGVYMLKVNNTVVKFIKK